MITALLSFAAAEMPAEVQLDDIDHWDAVAQQAVSGPKGCWRFEGDLKVTVTFRQKAGWFQRAVDIPQEEQGTFVGELNDGMWRVFEYKPSSGDAEIGSMAQPIFGTMPKKVETESSSSGDGDSKEVSVGVNLLHESMFGWKKSVGVVYAEWRDDLNAVQFVEDTELKSGQHVVKTTLFPNGRPIPNRISVMAPKKVNVGQWPVRIGVYDAQAHLFQRPADDVVLPTAETMSAVLTAFGFTLGYEQRLDYRTATRCTP